MADNTLFLGSLPLCISLNPSDVASNEGCMPVYVMVRRDLYLPLACKSVVDHFRSSSVVVSTDAWFESLRDSTPLKWNLPIGVLYDALNQKNEEGIVLPWEIQVHFQAYPREEILECPGGGGGGGVEEVVKRYFFHSMKQSLFIKSGGTTFLRSMSKRRQNQVWEAFKEGDLKKYQYHLLGKEEKKEEEEEREKKNKKIGIRVVDSKLHMRQYTIHNPECQKLYDLVPFPCKIAGIIPPKEITISQASTSLGHTDGFLYLVIK